MSSGPIQDVLSGKERKALRARAHSLKPVVRVAESGITPGAMREIDRALTAHELIKIHAAVEGKAARAALLADVCMTLGAQPVQVIGKMLVAFRHRPEVAPAPDRSRDASPRSAGSRESKARSNPIAVRNDRRRPRKPGP